MSRNLPGWLSLGFVVAVIAAVFGGPAYGVTPPVNGSQPAPDAQTFRLAGNDRYETAIKISQQWYVPGRAWRPHSVYIASGEDFPDALAAAPIAGLNRAPLLLTPHDALPSAVAAEVKRLNPMRVVVVGGEGAVSNTVLMALRALGQEVIRVAGVDRYGTAREIIRYGLLDHPDFTQADFFTANEQIAWQSILNQGKGMHFFVANAMNFPDALVIGAIGGNWFGGQPGPVFLESGTTSSLDPQTVQLMNDLRDRYVTGKTIPTYVIGGEGAISAQMYDAMAKVEALKPVTRIGGADRYETSQMIVKQLKQPAPESLPAQAVLATDASFPDALAGSTFAGGTNSALWVVPPTCVPTGVLAEAKNLKIQHWALLGGPGALTPAIDTLTECPKS